MVCAGAAVELEGVCFDATTEVSRDCCCRRRCSRGSSSWRCCRCCRRGRCCRPCCHCGDCGYSLSKKSMGCGGVRMGCRLLGSKSSMMGGSSHIGSSRRGRGSCKDDRRVSKVGTECAVQSTSKEPTTKHGMKVTVSYRVLLEVSKRGTFPEILVTICCYEYRPFHLFFLASSQVLRNEWDLGQNQKANSAMLILSARAL